MCCVRRLELRRINSERRKQSSSQTTIKITDTKTTHVWRESVSSFVYLYLNVCFCFCFCFCFCVCLRLVFVWICVYVCMGVCGCVYVYVFVCLFLYVYVFVRAFIFQIFVHVNLQYVSLCLQWNGKNGCVRNWAVTSCWDDGKGVRKANTEKIVLF